MAQLTYSTVDPGPVMSKAEFDAVANLIIDDYNDNIDNSNISPTAGIVDTKLAQITTANKVDSDALTSTRDLAFTHTATLTMAGAIVASGVVGIDYNPGSDIDTDIATVGVTGAPRMLWSESVDNFLFTKGITLYNTTNPTLRCDPQSDIDAALLQVVVTGAPLLIWDESEDAFSFNKAIVSAGGATGGFRVTPGSDIDVTALLVSVTGNPAISWDESEDRFSFNKGINLVASGISLVGSGITNGVLIDPATDTDADLISVGVTGSPKIIWDESLDGFASNKSIYAPNNTSCVVQVGMSGNQQIAGDAIITFDDITGATGYLTSGAYNESTYKIISNVVGYVKIEVQLDISASGTDDDVVSFYIRADTVNIRLIGTISATTGSKTLYKSWIVATTGAESYDIYADRTTTNTNRITVISTSTLIAYKIPLTQ